MTSSQDWMVATPRMITGSSGASADIRPLMRS